MLDREYFYTPDLEGTTYWLQGEEFIHAAKSFRRRVGDELYLVNGKGIRYHALVERLEKRKMQLQIVDQDNIPPNASHHLELVVAPTKSISRTEWMIEKCIEIGIGSIRPIHCHHSERAQIRTDRLQKIAIAAVKQSKRAWLPLIHEMQPASDYMRRLVESTESIQKFIGLQGAEQNLFDCKIRIDTPTQIWIGPEGGFSPEEIELAKEADIVPVRLGNQRLRTETAGVVAATLFNFVLAK